MSNQNQKREGIGVSLAFIAFILLTIAAIANLARKQEERRNAPPLSPPYQTAQPKRSI